MCSTEIISVKACRHDILIKYLQFLTRVVEAKISIVCILVCHTNSDWPKPFEHARHWSLLKEAIIIIYIAPPTQLHLGILPSSALPLLE